MAHDIDDARAFLRSFTKTDYADAFVRNGAFALFIARAAGKSANPLQQVAPAGAVISRSHEGAGAVVTVTAPHLASFVTAPPAGSVIAEGDVVAELRLLDEHITLTADQAGRIAGVMATPGALVEYGQNLVEIAI